jgi:hypothetical protein
MIMLVITLPMYSASVFASSITLDNIRGGDDISGFRGRVDVTQLDVDASVDGDTQISPNQIRTFVNGAGPFLVFDTCADTGDPSRCTSSQQTVLPSGVFTYEVQLFDDNGQFTGEKASAQIQVDDQAPQFTAFGVDASLTSSTIVELSFTVQDNPSNCVGLGEVELFNNDFGGESLGVIDLDETLCVQTITQDFSSPSGDGTFTVCGKVRDRLGLESTSLTCATFSVDQTIPDVEGSVLKDSLGQKLLFVGPNFIPVELEVNISDNNLVFSSVKAELSALGKPGDISATSCVDRGGNLSTCRWQFTTLIQDTVSPTITVKGEDVAGNLFSEDVSLGVITKDGVGPVVTSLVTDTGEFRGVFIVDNKVSFIAQVDDVIGVDKGNVFLDLSPVGLSATDKADSCVDGRCVWANRTLFMTHNQRVTIGTTLTTEDDLGNTAVAVKSIDIVADTQPPIIENLFVKKIPSQLDIPQGLIVKGERLFVFGNVTDDTIVSGLLFTDIFGDVSEPIANCRAVANGTVNKFFCSWETPAIEVSGPRDGRLVVRFEDFAGNSVSETATIFLSQINDDPDPNFFQSRVSCSPSFIDRQFAEVISQREFCAVQLQSVGVDAVPLDVTFVGCEGEGLPFIEDIDESGVIPSLDTMLAFNLFESDFADDLSFNVNCSYDIIASIDSTSVNAFPERETFEVDIPFSNFPQGEVSVALKNEIKEAIDDASGPLLDTIGMLQKVFDYAGKLCKIVSLVTTIKQLISNVTLLVDAAFGGNPLTEAIATSQRAADEAAAKATEGAWGAIGKFCSFLNCGLSPLPKGIKGTNDKARDGIGLGSIATTLGGGGSLLGLKPTNWGNVPFLSPNWFSEYTKVPVSSYLNGRDSIVIALLTLCVPGMIAGVDRYRQIQCQYANCLTDAVDGGFAKDTDSAPISACSDTKSYMTCKFVFGEIFNAIPIVAIFNFYINKIKSAISNPLAFVQIAIGFICAPFVVGPPKAYIACSIPKTITLVSKAIDEVINIIDPNFWKIRNDACDEVDTDFFDRFEDEELEPTGAGFA